MAIFTTRPAQDMLLIVVCWFLGSWPWLIGIHFIPWDSWTAFYPQSYFVADSLRHGDLPWWNPYQFAGIPVLGDPQSLLFTLHTLIGTILGDKYSLHVFDIVTLLHLLLGALAVYGIGHQRQVSRPWAVMAALVFMLGGVATCRLQHVPQIIAYGWLPVVLFLLLRVERRPTVGRALTLGILAAVWGLNANQVVFLGGLLLFAVGIYSLVRRRFDRRLLAAYCISAATALIVVAPVYASIMELVGLSTRADMSVAQSAWSSLPVHAFFSLILPALFGNLGKVSWTPTDISQDFLYIGLIPFLLFFLAVRAAPPGKRPLFWGWLTALLFVVLFSMGTNTAFYPFLYHEIPGFGLFRRPADGTYLMNLLLALGLLVVGQRLSPPTISPAQRPGWGFYLATAALFLALPAASFWLGAAAQAQGALSVLYSSYLGFVLRFFIIIGFAAVCFYVYRYRYRYRYRQRLVPLLVVSAAILFTVDVGLAGRFSGRFSEPYANNAVARSYRSGVEPKGESLDTWLTSHTSPRARVEVVGGAKCLGHSSRVKWLNTQGYNPIALASYASRLGAFQLLRQQRAFPEDSRGIADWRYDVLGLRYVAFNKAALENPLNKEDAYRAALVQSGATVVFTDDGYEVLHRPGEDLWLSVARSEVPGDLAAAPCEPVQRYSNGRLTVSCRFEEPGTLVLGEVYAPGWWACVDGRPVEIVPYFGVFRSILMPAGPTLVEMGYRPVPFLRGSRCEGAGH